jgi:hypothetical protein
MCVQIEETALHFCVNVLICHLADFLQSDRLFGERHSELMQAVVHDLGDGLQETYRVGVVDGPVADQFGEEL